jgi:hypothetical protein
MILEAAIRDFTIPDSRTADISSLANEEIALTEGFCGNLLFAEVHRVHFGEIDAPPENVTGAKERMATGAVARCRRDGLASADIEEFPDRSCRPSVRHIS